ncbi:MAG: 4Fe-4S dicluster domain-containing protein [Thermoproteota archaeon]
MMEKTYKGIPRNKIPWYPTIDREKCISCGNCVDFCHKGVQEFVEEQGEEEVVVKKPYNCVVSCTGCEDQCPVEAITFPSKEETQKLIEKKKQTRKKNE